MAAVQQSSHQLIKTCLAHLLLTIRAALGRDQRLDEDAGAYHGHGSAADNPQVSRSQSLPGPGNFWICSHLPGNPFSCAGAIGLESAIIFWLREGRLRWEIWFRDPPPQEWWFDSTQIGPTCQTTITPSKETASIVSREPKNT